VTKRFLFYLAVAQAVISARHRGTSCQWKQKVEAMIDLDDEKSSLPLPAPTSTPLNRELTQRGGKRIRRNSSRVLLSSG
jgi:hypothetical protein